MIPDDIGHTLHLFDVPVSELAINKDQILVAMGYDIKTQLNVPSQLYEYLDKYLDKIDQHVAIRSGYRFFPPSEVQIGKTGIRLQDKQFLSGRIINSQLKNAETLVVFVCTLGQAFDSWIGTLKASDDMLALYSGDTLGSEIVELSVDWLEKRISDELVKTGLYHTNRFSPGYCDWPIMDQHILFSLLPKNFCGIHVHKSALMSPIKSVSGIYGVGRSLRKRAYCCSICSSTNCYKRLHNA
ncbi:MAG: hypothetical protein H8E14_03140 [Candidatus Marinimicrobia bacterium]|nr:hypothetical protein [Candidatus Neomarinimicrobiota bacterium]MBL7113429.1 hypothetical protein [Bacteroidales bacterium]